MERSIFKKLIRRYLAGRANKAEKYVINRWYESLRDDPDTPFIPAGTDRLECLQQRILESIPTEKREPVWYRRTGPRLLAAAVVFCFLSLSLILYLRNDTPMPSGAENQLTNQTAVTGIKQVKHLMLPDSTEIFLNANSILEMPAAYGKDERVVILSGEAYFDVKRDTLRPFKIQVDGLEVQVLGTSFNISAYQQLADINVTVNSGKVQVAGEGGTLAVLGADEQLVYNRQTARYARYPVKSTDRSSWKTGVAMLDRASFDELALIMYNHYGIRLESQDKNVINTSYTFTLRSTRTLGQTMEQLCEMIRKKYRKEGDRIIIH